MILIREFSITMYIYNHPDGCYGEPDCIINSEYPIFPFLLPLLKTFYVGDYVKQIEPFEDFRGEQLPYVEGTVRGMYWCGIDEEQKILVRDRHNKFEGYFPSEGLMEA